jgi:dipeptidyl aminopeptidase/acylaminoacyl peptidase
MNADGSNLVRLTNNSADDEDPNWSPDGTKIAFISMRDGHYEIYTMNADGSNQTRITTTNGHAIDPDWKPITYPTSVKEGGQSFNSSPKNFQLFQNYPNPFNPGTSIQYAINRSQFVTLKVYDVIGKEIETLVNEEKPAGNHTAHLTGVDLASGIYFYRLQLDDGAYQTNKMCLIK